MKYISTRGQAPAVNSVEALLNGIAPDGGLYIPEVTLKGLEPLPAGADFRTTMEALLERFFDDIPADVRQHAVAASLARFRAEDVVPLKSFGKTHFLELFHGPTYAFKDVALTLLPHLMHYAAKVKGIERVCVLTATSGDTGSAAMQGFAGIEGTEVLVFYPQTGTSEIQRRQMVCCPGENVHACAIQGNFDDAQAAVKAAFADEALNARAKAAGCLLSSANSINIGRLFPQICYYIDCARRLGEPFDVVVPTGNFGNILAAHFASMLGAPIQRLVVASNANRVICDFVQAGQYDARREFYITNSPSMDILISSNVERLLYLLTQGDTDRVREMIQGQKSEGLFALPAEAQAAMKVRYASGWATPEETETAIRAIWEKYHYLADPHTAIGWKVLQEQPDTGRPVVIAGTASPWKFPVTMMRALTGETIADEFAAAEALAAFSGETPALLDLREATIRHTDVVAKDKVPEAIVRTFAL
ncbi:MAG: threonine synthase [bacterium]|nr:threonine synthase [bacterium]